jgi:gliding motility-associated-like protein
MTLFKQSLTILLLALLPFFAAAQQPVPTLSCASDVAMGKWLKSPAAKQLHQQIEQTLLQYRLNNPVALRPNAVVTLPIVIHIVHNNGAENISDAQAIQGVQYLNQAFANTGFYNPADGVDCQVQFCMARHDPAGNATNGITRNVSPLTNLNMDVDDIALKDLNRWNPLCYINVWLVKEICSSSGCGVAGYAYYPSAHGLNMDGIVMEANFFGSTPGNTGIMVHEMGHYLGLKHTFNGGCTNNNCLVDGDAVCDTPPDQSTGYVPCNGSVNSCNTDALSGFTSDQNDLHRDYMDYGDQNCFSMFTQGQADRMNWHITNVRSSLLSCQSCLDPCPAPVTANFTTPGAVVNAGSAYTFTNTSVNASGGYEWYVNGVLQAATTNFSLTFSSIGTYIVKLIAKSGSPLCGPSEKTFTIQAICPVTVGFTKSAATAPCGTNINFTNTSGGATGYEWYVNGVLQSTALNFFYTNTLAGKYVIKLVAKNTVLNCSLQKTDTVEYTCPITASFTPQSPSVYINTSVNFTNTSVGATTYQWLVNNIPAATTTNYGFTPSAAGNYVITLIAGNGICSVSQSTFVVAKDTCLRTTFQKKFGGAGNDLLADIRATADGGYIAAGYTNSFGAGQYDGVIVKTDAQGNLLWNKVVGSTGNDYLNKVIATSDGGYLAAGYTSSFGAFNLEGWMVKLNSSGTVLWSRKYSNGNPNGSVIWDICQTTDGGYAFAGTINYTPGLADAMIGKTDANGVTQWCRYFNDNNSDQSFGVLEDNGVLVVSAFGAYLNGGTLYDGVFMKLNRANGNVLSATRYDIEGRSNWFTYIYKQNNDYLVGCKNNSDFSNTAFAHIILRLDNNGLVKQVNRANSATDKSGGDPFTPTADGGYLLAQCENNGAADIHLRKNTPAGSLQWLKKYGTAGSNDILYSIIQSADNGFAGCGLTGTGGLHDFYIFKTDGLGESAGSCPPAATDGTNATPAYTSSSYTWPTTGNVVIPQANTVSPAITSFSLIPTEICAGTTCVPPVDTCFNTFQKTYGGSDDEAAYCVKRVPGSGAGYIVSGYTKSSGAGGQDGYLLRLAANGDVLWAKAYGGAGNDFFLKVRPTASGGFIATGRTFSFGNSTGAAYVVNVDANGNLLWSKVFGNATNFGEIAQSIIQTSDGGFALIGSYNEGPGLSDILVMRLDGSGNTIWSKAYNSGTTDEGIDLLEDNDSLVVTGYYRGGNFHDGIMMKLNKLNGNPYWIKAFDVNSDNDGLYRIEKVPGGYSMLTSSSNGFTNNGVKLVAMRVDINGNLTYSHQLTSATNKSVGHSLWNTSDGGYIETISEGAGNDDVYFYKINSQKQLVWKKRYNRPGNQNVYDIFEDGNSIMMTGLTSDVAGGPTNILIIKTNEYGNTPGCTTDSTDAVIASPQIVPVIYNPAIRDQVFSSFNPPATVVTNTTPAITVPCASAGCDSLFIKGETTVCFSTDTITFKAVRSAGCSLPVQWVTDPLTVKVISGTDSTISVQMLQTGSIKLYANLSTGCKLISDSIVINVQACQSPDTCGSYYNASYQPVSDFECTDFRTAKDKTIVAVGYRILPATGSDATIMKVNNYGVPIWIKHLKGNADERFVKLRETKNGNFAAIGYTNSFGASAKNILISRYTTNGTLRWSKVLNDNIAASENTGADIVENATGELIYCAKRLNAVAGNSIVVGKLDATGNIIWTKNIGFTLGGYILSPKSVMLDNDTLIITGDVDNGLKIGFVVKLNTNTGTLMGGRTIQTAGSDEVLINGIEKIAGGYSLSLAKNKKACIVDINTGLSISTQRIYDDIWFISDYFYTAPTPGNGHISLTYRTDANLSLVKTDSLGKLEWIRRVGEFPAAGSARIEAVLGGYIWAGTSLLSTPSPLKVAKIIKMGTATQLGLCNGDNQINTTLSNPGLVTGNSAAWSIADLTGAVNNVLVPTTGSETVYNYAVCGKSVLCDSLKLFGLAASCNLADTLTYYAKRNPLCQLRIQWQADPAFAQVISSTDSTIKIKWLKRGSTMLYALLQTDCSLLKDSISVLIANSQGSVNLGPDIQLCDASTISLHAGPGFKRYTWQDGFADSIYTAYLPGIYHVTVEDSCGNIYRDTVVISLAPTIPFDLGPALLRCNNDTLTITAPAGFSHYSWASNYNISSQQGQVVKVWPAVDTVYSVIATVANGCLLYDTIRIRVSQSPPIALGNDTSFCQGGSLPLNAGPGFTTYLWSTGAATQNITATAAGQYWVRGTTVNGCISTDTLSILNVYANPVINLGGDTSVCQGATLPLNAGAGYAGYLWSTGAITQNINVAATGLYWVQVTTGNNCRSRDSVQLLNIYPRPSVFIGNDTSFCQGGAVALNAGPGFSSYLWNTGAVSQSISASTAGYYWVQVANGFNCSSRDSMQIIAVFAKPVINLGRDTILCAGSSITLTPGNGFSAYLWQDNSIGTSYTTGAAGTYWVQVSNGSNCVGTDTMRVLKISPIPKNFAPLSAGMCIYEPLLVKGRGSYSKYLWSTGSTNSTTQIPLPGNYWLQVTNADGCAAKEDFTVFDKNCRIGIYFPKAFTPTGDARNDLYRPGVYGPLEYFTMEIYNRYGERIYRTTDPAKGWDGAYKGAAQNTGGYVWMSTYKFKDQAAVADKGSFLLIR